MDTNQNGHQHDLLLVEEVARMLRVDITTVRRWCQSGAMEYVELPHKGKRKLYRIKRATVDAILKR